MWQEDRTIVLIKSEGKNARELYRSDIELSLCKLPKLETLKALHESIEFTLKCLVGVSTMSVDSMNKRGKPLLAHILLNSNVKNLPETEYLLSVKRNLHTFDLYIICLA